MTTAVLRWIGDLDKDKRMSNTSKSADENLRPMFIEIKEGQNEIKIGRFNSTNPPHYLIESCINKRMISRNHATIERLPGGVFMLYDHSMNGTYVNFKRVSGGITLKTGDIVCFGHLNGANLKPGDGVVPFFSDLKYRAYVGTLKEVHAAIAADVAKSNEKPGGKRSAKSPESKKSESKSSGRHRSSEGDVKAKTEENEEVEEEEEDDDDGGGGGDDDDDESDDQLMDRLVKERKKAPAASKSNNGASSRRNLSPSPPQAKKSKSKRVREKELASDHDDNAGAEADVNAAGAADEDAEVCSARVCKKPTGNSIDWVQCDKCSKWYHLVCVNLTKPLSESENYFCPSCLRKRC